MKILMVSIPSLHFFRWTSQLQGAGHEVYWFDITGMSQPVERINWVKQKVAWKLRWDFPGRFFIKSKFPLIYRWLQKNNERKTAYVFEEYLKEVQPDVVHSFALQISCIPILEVMQKYKSIKWIYSSWGSDIFYADQMHIEEMKMKIVLNRIDYLITDCLRDFKITKSKGFSNSFLGVLPGNGGVQFNENEILPVCKRNVILIKGYNDSIGKGINCIKAINDELKIILKKHKVVVFGADEMIKNYILYSNVFKEIDFEIYLKKEFIDNESLLKLMGKSLIYIGNSISDGLPNSLIEAMGMGAFPIQSNPGDATAELINDRENGLLIKDPLNIEEIQNLIKEALLSPALIEKAFYYNTQVIKKNYQREKVKNEILKCYEYIF